MSPAWLTDGTLLFVSNRDGARDIYAVRLFPLGGVLIGSNIVPYYDLTPDDKRYVMVRLAAVNQAPGAGQLVVVDNWFEELRRKMGAARR